MPNLNHLWQRFLRATALLFGLAVGVGATVFAYSNTQTIDVGWSVFRLRGIPLWTAVIVPLVVVLAVAGLYHWINSFHHFTEHMRHRRRVHELEAEVSSLKAHLDSVLEMPDHASSGKAPAVVAETAPEAVPEPSAPAVEAAAAPNGDNQSAKTSRKRTPAVVADTAPVAEASPTEQPQDQPAEEAPAEA